MLAPSHFINYCVFKTLMSNLQILDESNNSFSWRSLLKPAILISIGLHGLLLLMPLAGVHQQSAPPIPKEEKVKLTELPTEEVTPSPSPAVGSPTPQPSPSVLVKSPEVSSIANPSPTPSPSASKSPQVAVLSKPIPTIKPSAKASPKPLTSKKPVVKPSAKAFTKPLAKKTSVVKPSPKASPKAIVSKPTPSTTPAAQKPAALNTPFSDFPKYPNSTTGAFDIKAIEKGAQQTPDDIKKVSSFYENELKGRSYQSNISTNTDNKKVYEVSKGGVTEYLTLIFEGGKGTVIVKTKKPLPDNLGNIEVASAQENAFDAALGRVPFQQTDNADEKLSDPKAFHDKYGQDEKGFLEKQVKNGIDGNIRFIGGQNPDAAYSRVFTSSLQQGNFQVTPKNSYGGGNLYEVRQGGFARYINLIPAKDGSGTIVVIWNTPPN
jgi:outer membrane biosynthesis protein TonB